jgi:hypothetical protein
MKILDEDKLQQRFKEIQNIRSNGLLDNELKIEYSREIIYACGQLFEVNAPPKKSMKMKSGNCYGNAQSKRQKGYGYVEGIIKVKSSGLEISHAWNVDSSGKHYDFTLIDTELYEYRGIVIPVNLHYEIASKTGKVWYCVLPYISFEK